ncbi:MAG: methyltransferase domain-containing protein [Syntrophobacteraceae bacterium]|jgi:ubiquinone/menaquinone biosynthesis C-methylase UbiE/uncharacterized protein YbaR (Trm112 family)
MKSGSFSALKFSLRHKCPACGAPLKTPTESEITCGGCARKYPVVGGIPSLLAREYHDGIFETYFYEMAKTGSDAARTVGMTHWQHSLLQRAFERIMSNIPDGSLVLDVGCGHGVLASSFAEKLTVVGIDYTFPMLPMARKHGLIPYHADATALPFENDQFDAVVCAELLQQFNDIGPVMSEATRVCRHGGSVIVSTLNRKSILRKLFRSGMRFLDTKSGTMSLASKNILRSRDELVNAASRLPFESCEVYWTHYPFSWLRRADANPPILEALASNIIIRFKKSGNDLGES